LQRASLCLRNTASVSVSKADKPLVVNPSRRSQFLVSLTVGCSMQTTSYGSWTIWRLMSRTRPARQPPPKQCGAVEFQKMANLRLKGPMVPCSIT
jgi:hypothetical protein